MNQINSKKTKIGASKEILSEYVQPPLTNHMPVQESSALYTKDLPQDPIKLFSLDEFPLFDEKEGIAINGSLEGLKKLLNAMVEKELITSDLKKLITAHDDNDWDKVQQLAHKIKGGAVYIGAVRMKMACQYLERSWKAGERAKLEQLYQQVLSVIDDTLTTVSDWLKR